MLGTTIILALILVGLCVLGMAVRVIFHRSHQFPETSAGENPHMQRLGIRCPRQEDEAMRSASCAVCLLDGEPEEE